MGLLWLVIANVVLFGLVRYISQSKHQKKRTEKVNWDGYDAVALTVAVYLVAQLAAMLIFSIALAFGGSGAEASGELRTSVTSQFFYILMVEGFTLASLHGLLKLRGKNLRSLGLVRPKWVDIAYAFSGFAVYIFALICVMALVAAVFPNVDLEQKQQIGFEDARTSLQLVLVFLSLVVLVPFTEEVLARGFLYLGLKQHLPKIAAVIITSVLFAVAHLQFGSDAPLLWAAAIDTFLLSLVLIFLRDVSGRLWAPIGLHALKNGIAFLALFVFVR